MIENFVVEHPVSFIVLIAFIVTLVTSLLIKFLTDQERMKELQRRQKEHAELMKKYKHDAKKLMEIQQEMLRISAEMMKHSFKPMLLTLVPFLLLFSWIRTLYANINIPWILYYFIFALAFSFIFRKLFKLY